MPPLAPGRPPARRVLTAAQPFRPPLEDRLAQGGREEAWPPVAGSDAAAQLAAVCAAAVSQGPVDDLDLAAQRDRGEGLRDRHAGRAPVAGRAGPVAPAYTGL